MTDRYDAIILGGGPAGSTVATLLAEAGRRVLVLEKETFPRFHIGESLLPASVGLFQRLGVNEELQQAFIHKPGGKWLYGSSEVPGDFANSDRWATFKTHPYSYLVERSTFDSILINRSIAVGADVRFGHDVSDLLFDANRPNGAPLGGGDLRVVGVQARDESGTVREFLGKVVVDCTGLRAFVGAKLGIRRPAHGQRMGIFAQYRADPTREDIQAGWFIGQMYYDGWTWLLRLPEGRFSVGTVLTAERFKRTKASAEDLLEFLVAQNPLLRDGMTSDPVRISPVQVSGHMGNRCSKLAGAGWVLAGDAAFFVDPCYSSGVHLAMSSAAMIADSILHHASGTALPSTTFDEYQKKMLHHERAVVRMVDAFYVASRNTSVQKMVTSLQGGYLTRKFVTFVGGDFSLHARFAWRVQKLSRLVAAIGGNDSDRAPENHPDYLIRELRARRSGDGGEGPRGTRAVSSIDGAIDSARTSTPTATADSSGVTS
jgi:flavin-dependent dehydrogenase